MTSLVAKKDFVLATRIEEAMRKNESLESLSVNSVRRDNARSKITEQKGKNEKLIKVARQRSKMKADSEKSSPAQGSKTKKTLAPTKSAKPGIKVSRSVKLSGPSSSRKPSSSAKKPFSSAKKPSSSAKKPFSSAKKPSVSKQSSAVKANGSKLNVVGFRGRSSWSNKKEPAMAR